MLYREVGEFKTSYAADQQTFPISFDKIAYFVALAIAFFVVPLVINDYWAKAILLPFLIFGIAAIGLNILTGYCGQVSFCLLYTSPSPRDGRISRMPSSA